ncbi:MAG: CHASE2 domain-containing protein [Chryseolinea sp.]
MRKFWLDCVLATVFVFLTLWGLVSLTQMNIFNAFDSIGEALTDVELTDYVFSGLRDDPDVDENIVIVNIGDLDRRGIAQEIQILSKYHPKVIGIDSFFDCRGLNRDTVNCPALKDTLGNLMFSEAIRQAGNVVLVTKVIPSDTAKGENIYDSLRRSDSTFKDYAYAEGYANLETGAAYQDDVKTCRTFNPKLTVNGDEKQAFSAAMARVYDSAKAKRFLARNNFSEVINYRGNVADYMHTTNYPLLFPTLDVEDVLIENFVPELIRDRIVILGYLGHELGDVSWADKFYTPLNKKMAGKANPDMFGVVVHANIVSMILHENYVEQMQNWQEAIMAFLICLLNVAVFSLINTNLPLYYDGITKLLQFLQLLLYSALMVLIFHWFSFKLDITITLAVVAVVGDVYEVYMSVIKNLFIKIFGWVSITPRPVDVLIPETPKKH